MMQLDMFGLMSLDCLVRSSIYARFFVTLAIPTLIIAIIQARAAAQRVSLNRRNRNVQAAIDRHDSDTKLSLMSVVRAKVVAAKIKARLAQKKKNAATGLTFAVPSPLNGDSFTLRFVFVCITFLIKRAVPRSR